MFPGRSVARQQTAQVGTGGRSTSCRCARNWRCAGRGYSAYCATKGGLAVLVKQHAMELAPRNITANGVAPTFIRS